MSKIRNPKDYFPKRFGLQYDPPAIILEYLLQPSGKLYHHKMRLSNLDQDSQPINILSYLKNKHYMYFLENKIKDHQIIILIEKIKSRLFKNQRSSNNLNNQNFQKKKSDEYPSPRMQENENRNKQDLYNMTENISPLGNKNRNKEQFNEANDQYKEQEKKDNFYYNENQDNGYLNDNKKEDSYQQESDKKQNNMWDEIDVGQDDDFGETKNNNSNINNSNSIPKKKSSDYEDEYYEDDFESHHQTDDEHNNKQDFELEEEWQ